MEIFTSEVKGVTLLEVSGRIDSINVHELGEALNARIEAGDAQIVVDLSGVEYVSFVGLRELVVALKKVKRGTGDLRLAGPSQRVVDTLKLAGVEELFETFPNQVEAMGSFG